MKNLISLLFLIFTIQCFALTDVDKQQLYPENLLSNGGFENGKAQWTASGGTFAIASSGSNLLIGKGSATWDSNGAAQTLSYAAITIPKGYYSRNGLVQCTFLTPSGAATHTLQAYDGTNVLASSTIMSSTRPVKTEVNFVMPASGTITVRAASVAADEPSITIDECYLGLASNITSAGPQDVFSAQVSDADVVSAENVDWINGNCTNATAGYGTCVFTSGIFTATPNCQVTSTEVTASGTNPYQCEIDGGNTNATQLQFYCKQAATAVNIRTSVSCQKASTDAPTYAYKPDTIANSWSGYHDSTCSWSRTNVAYGDFTADASCALVERTNRNFGTVSTSGSVLPAITFTPMRIGKYLVTVTFGENIGSSGATGAVRIWNGTNVIAEQDAYQVTSGSPKTHTLSGLVTVNSLAAVTLTVQGRSSAGAMLISGNAASNLEWSLVQIDQALPAPLLVNSVVSTYSGVVVVGGLGVANGGTPIINSQTGDWVDSLTDTGAGSTQINFKTGTFGAAPFCSCSAWTVSAFYCMVHSYGVGTVSVQTTNSSAIATDEDFKIVCVGTK